MTNFDRIKAMSVEELAPLLIQYRDDWDDCVTDNGIYDKCDEALKAEIEWLESEVEEECPLFPTNECSAELSGYALDLIKRYKTKCEQLDETIQNLDVLLRTNDKDYRKLLAENKELEAEIERRKNNLFCKVVIDEETMRNIINEKMAEFELDIKAIKAEAIKEFAERLKDEMYTERGFSVCPDDKVDNLVKEMVGD